MRLRALLKIMDVLELSPKEQEQIDWTWEDGQQGLGMLGRANWGQEDKAWRLRLEDHDFAILQSAALNFEHWKPHALVVGMLEKLQKGGEEPKKAS